VRVTSIPGTDIDILKIFSGEKIVDFGSKRPLFRQKKKQYCECFCLCAEKALAQNSLKISKWNRPE
jgi:hypothetical protein